MPWNYVCLKKCYHNLRRKRLKAKFSDRLRALPLILCKCRAENTLTNRLLATEPVTSPHIFCQMVIFRTNSLCALRDSARTQGPRGRVEAAVEWGGRGGRGSPVWLSWFLSCLFHVLRCHLKCHLKITALFLK